MKRLTEQQVRKVIREEIRYYLLEQEEPKKDDKPKSKFRKIITSTAVALLGFFAGTSYNPEVQAVIPTPIEDIGSDSDDGSGGGSDLEEISKLIDATYEELVKLGATDQYAQSLVSRTVEYGNIEFEIRAKQTGIKNENRAKEYESFMLSRFSALQNPEALSKVASQDFLQRAQSVGTHRIMMAQINPETGETSIGTPIPSYSLQVAFAYEMLTIVEEEEETKQNVYTKMIVDSFNKETNSYVVKPTILPFFQQVAKEGSPFQKAILDVIPQVNVAASIFEEEQNNNVMEKINKQLGATVRNKKSVEENKVNKLRQKINELRGVYV
jgi:hypothetical protein